MRTSVAEESHQKTAACVESRMIKIVIERAETKDDAFLTENQQQPRCN